MFKRALFVWVLLQSICVAQPRSWTYLCCDAKGGKIPVETIELPALKNCGLLTNKVYRNKCAYYYINPRYIGLTRTLNRDAYYPKEI